MEIPGPKDGIVLCSQMQYGFTSDAQQEAANALEKLLFPGTEPIVETIMRLVGFLINDVPGSIGEWDD
jgi:hypothetical protein